MDAHENSAEVDSEQSSAAIFDELRLEVDRFHSTQERRWAEFLEAVTQLQKLVKRAGIMATSDEFLLWEGDFSYPSSYAELVVRADDAGIYVPDPFDPDDEIGLNARWFQLDQLDSKDRLRVLQEYTARSAARNLRDTLRKINDGLMDPMSPSLVLSPEIPVEEAARKLDLPHVVRTWKSARTFISQDPARALTHARSLLEIVLKSIIATKQLSEPDKIKAKLNTAWKALELDNSQYYQQLRTGLSSIEAALFKARDEESDAHGRLFDSSNLSAREAYLFVTFAGAMSVYLMGWQLKRLEEHASNLEGQTPASASK